MADVAVMREARDQVVELLDQAVELYTEERPEDEPVEFTKQRIVIAQGYVLLARHWIERFEGGVNGS